MSNIKLFWPGLPPLAALAPPRIIDNYPAYTTLRLLDECRKEKGPQYLVDWKQFGPEEHRRVSHHHNLDCHLVWESHIQHADGEDLTLPIQLTRLSLSLPSPPHLSVGVDCLREVWWSWSMPSSTPISPFWLESISWNLHHPSSNWLQRVAGNRTMWNAAELKFLYLSKPHSASVVLFMSISDMKSYITFKLHLLR